MDAQQAAGIPAGKLDNGTEVCTRLKWYYMLQVRIVKEDGAVGLFRGAGPTVVRAMALNMGMLASNDEVSCQTLSSTDSSCLILSPPVILLWLVSREQLMLRVYFMFKSVRERMANCLCKNMVT